MLFLQGLGISNHTKARNSEFALRVVSECFRICSGFGSGNAKPYSGHHLIGHSLTGGERNRGCARARACAGVHHTNDTHAFPQTTLPKSRLIASSARHSLVTEKKSTPIKVPAPL